MQLEFNLFIALDYDFTIFVHMWVSFPFIVLDWILLGESDCLLLFWEACSRGLILASYWHCLLHCENINFQLIKSFPFFNKSEFASIPQNFAKHTCCRDNIQTLSTSNFFCVGTPHRKCSKKENKSRQVHHFNVIPLCQQQHLRLYIDGCRGVCS